MGIALAAAVAGRLHVHQPGVLAVLHVADQDAVLDQHGAVGRRALVVDRQRAAPRGHGAVVDHGDALGGDLLAHQAGESRSLLAVEIALEPMADGLVQHHAGPPGPEHHVHLAGGRRHRFQIDHRLADRAVGGLAPRLGLDEARITLAAAIALAAALLPVALPRDHGNIDAHQGADVAIALAVGPQDLHHLPGRAQADGDLPHPRILVADIGVDLGEQFYLRFEAGRIERIFVAIEPHIGVGRGGREIPAIAAAHGRDRVRGANQRRQRDVGGMRIADRVVLHRAQAQTLARCRRWPASAGHCRTSALRSGCIPGTTRRRRRPQAPARPGVARNRDRDWRGRAGRLWGSWKLQCAVAVLPFPRNVDHNHGSSCFKQGCRKVALQHRNPGYGTRHSPASGRNDDDLKIGMAAVKREGPPGRLPRGRLPHGNLS